MRDSVMTDEVRSDAGTSSVEHLVLVVTVALVFAAATLPLGALLMSYHRLIESVLFLPVP
jgi:hypothetical protein